MTYVSAPTATGARSTLSVRVDTVEWEEVPSLFGLDPRREAYAVRLEDDGTHQGHLRRRPDGGPPPFRHGERERQLP